MRFLYTLALSLLLVFPAVAQNMLSVSGTVVDGNNEPVIGASVVLKGTSRGVITGMSGEYSIQAPSDGTLVFSFIGMTEKEEQVGGRTQINVILSEDANELDEVVVVGYGVMRKSDITGAVSSVKVGDAVKSMPVAQITDALQGRLAGVSIISNSGAPGSSNVIRVRGINSINGDAGPLVVIDGFIGGDMASLNPADIESIEVLKDASATAIYGSRGANGVLLVTTKRASKGGVQVTYNGYANLKTPAKLPKQLSAAENARLQNDYITERYENRGLASPVSKFTDDEIAALEASGGYDYIDNTFKSVALEQMHELSIAGRSEKSSFLISGSFNDNNGIIYNSNARRANYRVKIDSDIKSWLKVGVNVWGTYNESQGPPFGQYKNVLNRALSFPRFIMAEDGQGGYNDLSQEPNPMRKINEIKKDGYTYNSWLQGYAEFTILPGLTFRTLGGITLRNTNSQNAYTKESYQAHPSIQGYTSAVVDNSNAFSWLNSNILSYVKEFNKNHRINATLVFEQQQTETYTSTVTARDFYDPAGVSNTIEYYDNLSLGSKIGATSERVISTLMSGLARVNYVLFDRYMVTASYRYDGSSRLAKGNKWHGFPSAALAWDVKKESFMQDVEVMSQAKLRLGYGVTGNQAVTDYISYGKFNTSKDELGNVVLTPVVRPNPDLKWESTTQYNVGVDVAFLSNRITASIDLYHKMSKDVILSVALPPSVGYKEDIINAAHILNKGIEVTIGADPIATGDLRWHTDLTLTKNVGTLERIDGTRSYMQLTGNYEQTAYSYIVGEKIGTMWGYTSDGIWKTSDLAENPGITPGSYRYKDIFADGTINEKDMGIIGCGQPAFNWGWNNTLTYKDFDFSIFLIGYHGFDIFNNNEWLSIIDNRVSPNPDWLNRWTPENENTDIVGFVGNNEDRAISSRKIEKGDFVKIKNLTIGYTLPRRILDKAGIGNLRVYASLQNLHTFTGYSGMDPEVTLKNTLTPGADWGYYPNGRNFIFGVNFTF